MNVQTHPEVAKKLLGMIGASWMSQALYVAAELRIADLLASGPSDIDALARAAQCQRTSLHRLMRALATLGFCVELEDGSFEITAMGLMLCAEGQSSVRSCAIWWGRYQWPVWGNLLYSVRTGESARRLVTGYEGYEHLEDDSAAAAVFNKSMSELTQLAAREVARVYDFSGARRLIDIGGGYGELLNVILAAYPKLYGILFELPHAIGGARELIAQSGLESRCEVVAGNFFDSVPKGGDLYLLKSVLHNWDDDQCRIILQNCRRAMPNAGRLLLVERVMPARTQGSESEWAVARADLNMLVGPGGRERTESELGTLLATSAFEMGKLLATDLDYCVIEGVPI